MSYATQPFAGLAGMTLQRFSNHQINVQRFFNYQINKFPLSLEGMADANLGSRPVQSKDHTESRAPCSLAIDAWENSTGTPRVHQERRHQVIFSSVARAAGVPKTAETSAET